MASPEIRRMAIRAHHRTAILLQNLCGAEAVHTGIAPVLYAHHCGKPLDLKTVMSGVLLEVDEPETLEAALSFLDAFELPNDPDFHVQTINQAYDEPVAEPSVILALPPAEKPTDVFVFGGTIAQGTASPSQMQLAAKALANVSNKGQTRPRPRDFNPNRARDERREELLYLRTKVVEMESQLEELKKCSDSSKKISRPASCSSIVTAGIIKPLPSSAASRRVFDSSVPLLRGRIQPSGSIWEDVAVRQYAERQKAELENIRLRTLLEGQIKVAKGLERLLNKRSNNQVRETCFRLQ